MAGGGSPGQRISTIVEAGYCVFGLVSGLAGGAFAALIAWWVLAASRPRQATGSPPSGS